MADIPPHIDDTALWRYSIISSLLHRHEDSPPLYVDIRVLAQRPWFDREGKERYFSADTLRYWLWRYKNLGLDGLRNKPRKDCGKTSVPDSLQQALVDLRQKHPLFTVKRLLGQLRNDGLWNGRKPSRTAVYRFTAANRLNRNSVQPEQNVRPFAFPYFGDLWGADFLHGPVIKQGTYVKKTYLHLILDDATRYIVAATFHLAENTESLLSDLMLAIRRFGICRRFYTDNGSAYRSKHLRVVAAKLRIALPHTPPYKPRGRGKTERIFRSIRDSFLTGRPRSSLTKLNSELNEWIAQYHQTPHSSLNMSPLNRKLIDAGEPLVQIDPTQNINDLFRMETTKTVRSDGCIRFWNKRFEVSDALPGEAIQIYYLPWDHEYILLGPDKLFAKALDPIQNAYRFNQPVRGKRNNTEKQKGKNYHE